MNQDTSFCMVRTPLPKKLKKLGTPYWLYTYCNASHEIASKPMSANFDEIIDFCYSYIINKGTEQKNNNYED